MQLLFGFLSACLIAFVAFRAQSLSSSGAYAAVLVGTVIFGMGGWQWALLLLIFFVSSTALTRANKKRKTGLIEKFSKGGQRDAGQVFGNGGIATLFAGLHYYFPESPWVWLAFAGSLAAVNADTWSTELGVLSSHSPRMITNLTRVVEKGTSGGISLIGTLAALAGAAIIGVLAAFFPPLQVSWLSGLLVILAGFLGSLFDSLLGATIQAIYHCPLCEKETERFPLHTCGTPTIRKRGLTWLNNDLVNLGCSVFAVVFVLVLSP